MDQKPSDRIREIENNNTPSWEYNRLSEDEILHRRINAVIEFLDEEYLKKQHDRNNNPDEGN